MSNLKVLTVFWLPLVRCRLLVGFEKTLYRWHKAFDWVNIEIKKNNFQSWAREPIMRRRKIHFFRVYEAN